MGQAALVTPVELEPVIEVTQFHKQYRKQSAVTGIDLSVDKSEMYGLIGPDGSGKSSIMKALAGVMTYDGGSVKVFGNELDTEASAERIKHRIGFMPQGLGLSLYPELSVEENIDFFARLRLVSTGQLTKRKERLLRMTRLENFRARPVKNLSGGMKQKLGLICTLIHEPELLILDEPTTGVDPVSRRDFWTILTELVHEQGITVLVTTAYLDEASRFHRISLMFGGKVLVQGEPEEIENMVPGHVVMLKTREQFDAYERLATRFHSLTPQGNWLRIFVEQGDSEQAKQEVLNGIDESSVEEIYTAEPELEDTFVALLRRNELVTERVGENTNKHYQYRELDRDTVAIEARELSRSFGDFQAAADVSFRVNPGEIFGLLGPNGAGKTTVIKMLTGILKPTAGGGTVAGADVRRPGRKIKRHIGYMSQLFSLYAELTVLENIQFYAGIYGLSLKQGRERSRWIIDMAGLSRYLDWRTASLPVGMRQRLALGCALLHRPRVLFLDEPTSGVDPIGRQQFWDVLFELSREDGVAVLVTTHYMSEAEHCDRLALMYDGRLVADASPEAMKQEVEQRAGHLLQITAEDSAGALRQIKQTGIGEPMLFGKRIHVLSQNPETDRQKITGALQAAAIKSSVEPRTLSMEDVFVYWVTQLEQGEQLNNTEALV